MKKMFLRAGAFAGLAVSALALASCGGSNDAEVKDLDGNSYKIAATEDATAVSKALVLVANSSVNQEKKNYAFSVDASLDANVTIKSNGISGTIAANAKAYAGVTMGNKEYKSYTPTETGYAEADVTEAAEFVKKNIGALVSAEGSLKVSNLAVDETAAAFAQYSAEEIAAVKEQMASYNNKTAKANARAFLYEGAFYVECDATAPKEFFHATEDQTINYYGKLALPIDDIAPMISSALNDYQTLSYDALIEKYSALLADYGFELPVSSLPSMEISADFFSSEQYKQVEDVIKALGVKISAVKDNKVTFDVDLTVNKIVDAVKAVVGDATATAILSMLDLGDVNKDTVFLSLSCTYDAAKNTIAQIKVSSSALDVLGTLVSSVIGLVMQLQGAHGQVSMPFDSLSGNFTIEANFKVDGDVSFNAAPDANKTYVDMDLDYLPFAA